MSLLRFMGLVALAAVLALYVAKWNEFRVGDPAECWRSDAVRVQVGTQVFTIPAAQQPRLSPYNRADTIRLVAPQPANLAICQRKNVVPLPVRFVEVKNLLIPTGDSRVTYVRLTLSRARPFEFNMRDEGDQPDRGRATIHFRDRHLKLHCVSSRFNEIKPICSMYPLIFGDVRLEVACQGALINKVEAQVVLSNVVGLLKKSGRVTGRDVPTSASDSLATDISQERAAIFGCISADCRHARTAR